MSESTFALKDSVPFAKMASQELSYELTVPKELLKRLEDACHCLNSDANLKIRFYRDLQGLNVVEGEVSIEVQLICARCFKPYIYTLHSIFKSTPDEEKAQSLRIADKLDLIELDAEGGFDTLSYIEDCLLLEIPLICEHEDETECELKGDNWEFGEITKQDTDNPFKALEALKENFSKK